MITITDLHKKFYPGTANEVYALCGIDLKVNAGDFVTIIGTNGSGKSTLLNAVAGTFLPDSGKIEIAGEDTTYKKDYQRVKFVSRVFQNPFMGTAPDMTIAENLHMAWLRGHHRHPKIGLGSERRNAYREAVAQLEMQLEDRLDNLIGTLSGGQRQALTLLMAVISEPKVLLLDEHTAALDPKSAAQIIKMTKYFIERSGFTTLMVTHSMQQALDLGSRTIMMNKGKVIDDIPLAEKNRLTVEDLLSKFAEIRKVERLTDDLLQDLQREYV
ncbi:MAG TPA: ATP-binding cassette domain-containing protein [bacterium]|nr:ATP-binding cassette domain-containing protein [bacterium]HPO09098.1 ATP-binding cassette domain-containing protein [bacterium]HQP98949.1 ATP-binding cassette domain-containing protein [bacterium]